MSTGKLLLVYPSGASIEEVVTDKKGPSLETLQRVVGGCIERIKVRYNDRTRDAYVNEDGIAKNLPYNGIASRMTNGTIFAGANIVGVCAVWIPDPKRKEKM